MKKMGKKKGKNQEKVYKANTKAIKILGMVSLVALVLVVFAVSIRDGITYLYLQSWQWHKIEDYHFEMKLPRAYQEEATATPQALSAGSIFTTDTEVKVNEEYVSRMPKVVYMGGNVLNGVTMKVQCLKTNKTTRTLDDLADSMHVLVRVYYEDEYEIGAPTKEYVTILGYDAVGTTTTLVKEEQNYWMTNYLVPTDEEEITITFFGKEENRRKAQEEIQKIVAQMRFF